MIKLEKLAYAVSAAPFVVAGVRSDEGRVAEAARLVEGALGKAPGLVPGGGAVSAEAERWASGLGDDRVKAAVARIAEGLGRWLEAVKSGRYTYHSSGRAARICAGDACAVKTREWAVYLRPVKIEAGRLGEVKEKWIFAKSPEELEAWLSRAGSAYVAPALFFEGGGAELRVVAVSEAAVAEVRRRLEAVRGAGGIGYDALAASARRGVLTARAGDAARLWRAYMDGVESYLTDPAKREELTREAERWIKALRLNTTAEEALRRLDLGAKAVNIGGVRLGLVHRKDRGLRAEKYGDPQLIAEIRTALENKLREMLGEEYEQWKNHIQITEGGRRLDKHVNCSKGSRSETPTPPKHSNNTKKLKNIQKQRHAPTNRCAEERPAVDSPWGDRRTPNPQAYNGRSRVQGKPAHKSRRADP